MKVYYTRSLWKYIGLVIKYLSNIWHFTTSPNVGKRVHQVAHRTTAYPQQHGWFRFQNSVKLLPDHDVKLVHHNSTFTWTWVSASQAKGRTEVRARRRHWWTFMSKMYKLLHALTLFRVLYPRFVISRVLPGPVLSLVVSLCCSSGCLGSRTTSPKSVSRSIVKHSLFALKMFFVCFCFRERTPITRSVSVT